MAFDLFLLTIGGALLYFGAEWLVEGAAGMAVRLGVPPLLIGLTIVSYATSAPELAVSVTATLKGDGPLVLGNVIGSNIANIALILGITALISPPKTDGSMATKELLALVAATLLVPLCLLDGTLSRTEGLFLLLGSVLFTWLTIRWSKSRPAQSDDDFEESPKSKGALIAIGLGGLVVLVAGGEVFVHGAIGTAEALGIDQRVIGLTVVAFGTSVPELAASVVAALRGHSDLAVGNVVGSNIFNILLVLGTAGALNPFQTEISVMYLDLAVLGALTLGAAIMLSRKRVVSRTEGVLLTSTYFGFLAVLVMQLG